MTVSLPILRWTYERSAMAYLRSLPLEHFMESTGHATQRMITIASLKLVQAQRPEVQLFNELLIQYPLKGGAIGKVVPDNMVVFFDKPIVADGSYDMPFQPKRPFWVMEYVSKNGERKDEKVTFAKYEKDLKIPYYLLYYLDVQEFSLWKRRGGKYVSVKPNRAGLCPVKELDMAVGLHEGWARFWFQGRMLPLPGDLLNDLNETRQRLNAEKRRADEEARRADEEARRADEEARRADEKTRKLEESQQARRALEEELKRLRAMLKHQP